MSDQNAPPPAAEPVEEYLDRLLLTLPGPPRQVRRTLAEVEAHLQDAVAEGLAAGLPEPQAQAAAVARIGPVHATAGRPALLTAPLMALLRRIVLSGALIGAVGLIAFGCSAGISWALAVAHGGTFVTAPFPAGSYSQADCARWLAGDPGARDCLAAMTADHVGDIVLSGAAGLVAGLALLALSWWLRRRWQDHATRTALPAGSAEAAGAALALLVMIATLGGGIDAELVQRGIGAGQLFSLAVAALGAAAFFGLRLRQVTGLRPASA
ncbi:MAG TPA: permease prefix domain 1-containing protein [Streptosporangiaceae bacterium]|jgi:hypothetical protein